MLPCFLKVRAMLARAKQLGTSCAEERDISLSFPDDTMEALNEMIEAARSEQVKEQRNILLT